MRKLTAGWYALRAVVSRWHRLMVVPATMEASEIAVLKAFPATAHIHAMKMGAHTHRRHSKTLCHCAMTKEKEEREKRGGQVTAPLEACVLMLDRLAGVSARRRSLGAECTTFMLGMARYPKESRLLRIATAETFRARIFPQHSAPRW